MSDDAIVKTEISICADAGVEILLRPRACSCDIARQTEFNIVASDDKNFEVADNKLQERASVVLGLGLVPQRPACSSEVTSAPSACRILVRCCGNQAGSNV